MNETVGEVDSFEFFSSMPYLASACLTILGLASLLGTFGNMLVLVAVATKTPLRSGEAILIVTVALSDLYVTMIMDPMAIVAKLEGEDFFDRIPGLCQAIASGCTVSCVTSTMTVVILSVNRYVYICKHEMYHLIFTNRNTVLMCLSAAGIGVLLVLMNAAGVGDHKFDRKSLECIWDRMTTYNYTVFYTVLLVWMPSVFIAVCFLRIYLYVHCNRRRVMPAGTECGDGRGPDSLDMRLARTLLLIYAVFVTCWVPYAVLIVVDSDDTQPHLLHILLTLWAHLHPSFNWIIYYFTNKKFAKAYKDIFRSSTATS